MEFKSYVFRIYPSKRQVVRLNATLNTCKEIYNSLLARSIEVYRNESKTLTRFDYNKINAGKYESLYSQVVQNVSDRVHKSFQYFFKRIKDENCRRKGFPRYKSAVKSLTYPQSGFKLINKRKLYVSKLGAIPIVLHNSPGIIKTLTIKHNAADQWFAILACENVKSNTKNINESKIGIDVGIENFATLSNGTVIQNPRYLVKAENKLKKLHKSLSKRKKSSNNRKKAIQKLAKQYVKVSNQRKDFLDKLSRSLTDQFDEIAIEDLKTHNLLRNHKLAKHISDASWRKFFKYLEYKAVISGSRIIKIDPRNTSKMCSNCGTIQSMPLSQRKFSCNNCKLTLHRDLNSAINIKNGMVGLTRTYMPVDDYVKPHANEVEIYEAGTK